MKNNNGAIARKLTKRSLAFNKRRNVFIIAAITLTAFMLTSIISVSIGLFDSMQVQITRLRGQNSHIAFGLPDDSELAARQLQQLSTLDYVDSYGAGHYVATVDLERLGDIQLHMASLEELMPFFEPAWVNIIGSHPQYANEIMASRDVLNRLGIENPEIGMEITLPYVLVFDTELRERTFTLSGIYTDFSHAYMRNWRFLLVSEELAQEYGLNLFNAVGSVNLRFRDGNRVHHYMDRLATDIEMTPEQLMGRAVNPNFDTSLGDNIAMIGAVALAALVFMFTGYLLIYNVLYISVSRDVRFFGLLKTIGTTPKQIRRIVTGQIMRLCLVGIPLGLALGTLVSLVIVPLLVANSGIDTGAEISFSPFIYAGAAVFTLITAYLGAVLPAKKVAGIAPVEAVKYTGELNVNWQTKSLTNGKIYKMAIRNIFRDRKRAAVVFLSLFFGVTTFVVITTIVSSMDIEKHITYEMGASDFVLQCRSADGFSGLSDSLVEQIHSLPGLYNAAPVTARLVDVFYQPALSPHVDRALQRLAETSDVHGMFLDREHFIGSLFNSSLTGIDESTLMGLIERHDTDFDTEAFIRGELALIITDYPELYDNLHYIEVQFMQIEGIRLVHTGEPFALPIGGFLPISTRWQLNALTSGQAPQLIVSNNFLMNYAYESEPIVRALLIDAEAGHDTLMLADLQSMLHGNFDIRLQSRIELRQNTQDNITMMYILGGGIAIILSLIGILNFINTMSAGVLVRKREFATLESIGMTRKQLRKMLIDEGLGYAFITLAMVAVLGSGISVGIYHLTARAWGDFMVLAFPVIPVIITSVIILLVCIIVPELAYRSTVKSSIVERLREGE